MNQEQEKWIKYAAHITAAISNMLDEEEGAISIDELKEDNNLAHFFHAFTASLTRIYAQWTEQEIDFLEFNHIQNRLCFQFGKKQQ